MNGLGYPTALMRRKRTMAVDSVLSQIDARIDARCMTKSLNKRGCAVDTNGAPVPSRVIDMDHAEAPVKPTAQKCDYLYFATDSVGRNLLVTPLELMNTGLNPAKVESQLQAGARTAEGIVRGMAPIRFVPVAVHGRELRRRVFQELHKKRIRFRQVAHRIKTLQCGDSLAWALE